MISRRVADTHNCQHFLCFSSHLFFPSLSSAQWCAQKRKSSSSVHLMVSTSHKLPVTLCDHHSHAMHVRLVLITLHSMSGQEAGGKGRSSCTSKGPCSHPKHHAAVDEGLSRFQKLNSFKFSFGFRVNSNQLPKAESCMLCP